MRARRPDTPGSSGTSHRPVRGANKPPPALPIVIEHAPIPDRVPEPPESLNDEGQAYWVALWYDAGGAYGDSDRSAIERYCSLQQRRHHLLRLLDVEGWITAGSKGQPIAHPAARLLSDIESKLTPLEDRLGLNPDARIRLGIGAQALRRSRLDAFLDETEDTYSGRNPT